MISSYTVVLGDARLFEAVYVRANRLGCFIQCVAAKAKIDIEKRVWGRQIRNDVVRHSPRKKLSLPRFKFRGVLKFTMPCRLIELRVGRTLALTGGMDMNQSLWNSIRLIPAVPFKSETHQKSDPPSYVIPLEYAHIQPSANLIQRSPIARY